MNFLPKLLPVFALSFSLIFLSCEKNAEFDDTLLHGDWVLNHVLSGLSDDGVFTYSHTDTIGSWGNYYGSDQSWINRLHDGQMLVDVMAGTWKKDGDFLIRGVEMLLLNSPQPVSPIIYDTLTLISLSANTLKVGVYKGGQVIQEETYSKQ